MLLKRTILTRDFSTLEEALAPLAEALRSREDIVGSVTSPVSTFTCLAPTYGRWGSRFRYEARVAAEEEGGKPVLAFELMRPTFPEVTHIAAVFAFWILITGLGDHRYVGLGIALAVCSTIVRTFFLIAGASRIAEAFVAAYGSAQKKPNQ